MGDVATRVAYHVWVLIDGAVSAKKYRWSARVGGYQVAAQLKKGEYGAQQAGDGEIDAAGHIDRSWRSLC